VADTLWQRLVRGAERVRQRPDWVTFAGTNWSETIMAVKVTDRFHAKQGRSTGRWVLRSESGRLVVYVKRHYQLARWRGLLAALWPGGAWSPAAREWRQLSWARARGLPVPEAVAAAEYIGPWTRFQSMLAIEELAGMLPLNEAVPRAATQLSPADFRRWKRTLAIEVARLVCRLHQTRHFHKDLYLCHLYILASDTQSLPAKWQGRVHVIDLHRLAHHPVTWRIWQVKDLAQLLYSSEINGIDGHDRAAFWRIYRSTRKIPRRSRWLRRCVLWKARRYRRHNQRKRR
jgi:heptose I phosphotransferase